MNDELKQIEIETARIKLERERMALDDELRKRQRVEEAKEVAADVANTLGSFKPLLMKIGKVILWIAGVYAVVIAIAIIVALFEGKL